MNINMYRHKETGRICLATLIKNDKMCYNTLNKIVHQDNIFIDRDTGRLGFYHTYKDRYTTCLLGEGDVFIVKFCHNEYGVYAWDVFDDYFEIVSAKIENAQKYLIDFFANTFSNSLYEEAVQDILKIAY